MYVLMSVSDITPEFITIKILEEIKFMTVISHKPISSATMQF